MAWIMEIVVIGCTLTLWILFYRRMIPLLSPKRKFPNKIRMAIASVKGSSTKTLTHRIDEEEGGELKNENGKSKIGKNLSLPIAPGEEDRRGKLSIVH
jgi:hypothetical protein